MTQPPSTPLLAANKALDEIIAIAETHQPMDKFTHDRLEREAKSSISTDAAFSYATLGALEAVFGNEELMDMYHRNSIKLSSNYQLVYENYAGSLHHVLRFKEAAENARLAASLAPDDLNIVAKAINYTVHSGEISMAASMVGNYTKLTPENPDAYEDLIKAVSLQKKNGIADQEIIQLVQIACDFLRSKQFYFVGQELIVDDEDDGFLSFCVNLNLTNEEVWNFNRQLFEIMLDKVPDQSPSLSVRFSRNHIS